MPVALRRIVLDQLGPKERIESRSQLRDFYEDKITSWIS